jgi:hypothetical protein
LFIDRIRKRSLETVELKSTIMEVRRDMCKLNKGLSFVITACRYMSIWDINYLREKRWQTVIQTLMCSLMYSVSTCTWSAKSYNFKNKYYSRCHRAFSHIVFRDIWWKQWGGSVHGNFVLWMDRLYSWMNFTLLTVKYEINLRYLVEI